MVDDEATIIVTYPSSQDIIQASWNWPFSRKDMDIYGTDGYIYTVNQTDGTIRVDDSDPLEFNQLAELRPPHHDPFAFLAAVVRGDVDPEGTLSSLSINMIAMEILDAAIRSAKSGTTIQL